MKYAKFSDEFLSDFRLDDNGETLVLTDKRGYTRALKLLTCEERPKGEWEFVSRNCWKCSNCQELTNEGKNFCPHCGAKMEGEEE